MEHTNTTSKTTDSNYHPDLWTIHLERLFWSVCAQVQCEWALSVELSVIKNISIFSSVKAQTKSFVWVSFVYMTFFCFISIGCSRWQSRVIADDSWIEFLILPLPRQRCCYSVRLTFSHFPIFKTVSDITFLRWAMAGGLGGGQSFTRSDFQCSPIVWPIFRIQRGMIVLCFYRFVLSVARDFSQRKPWSYFIFFLLRGMPFLSYLLF